MPEKGWRESVSYMQLICPTCDTVTTTIDNLGQLLLCFQCDRIPDRYKEGGSKAESSNMHENP
jgi:hypothetical protein